MASLVACGSHEASAPVSSEHEFSKSERVQTSEPENEVPQISDNSTLVVYFSMPETTDPDNMTEEEANSTVVVNGQVLGNTQYVAYVIQENTGADIFRIRADGSLSHRT